MSMQIGALLDGSPYGEITDLSVPAQMPMAISYFNSRRESFAPGDMVLCNGTVVIQDRGVDNPAVGIKAHSLIKYVLRCPRTLLPFLTLLVSRNDVRQQHCQLQEMWILLLVWNNTNSSLDFSLPP
jgi:hypothetical protein